MKKILLCVMAMALMTVFYSCKQNNMCRIEGVVKGEQYEGKRIFLVPLYGPKTAEYVDSMEVTNGQFHFEPDSMQMYQILMDYHYRFALQPLLIVGEPGNIKVIIDSVSHASGTPQNDTLEKWKEQTEIHNLQWGMMRRSIAELQAKGDTMKAKYLAQRADSFHLAYKNYTRQLVKNLKEGVLYDFLKDKFPLTYKRKYPDGREVTINADTNEEIEEGKSE